jgi:hypothetical protein
MNKKLQVHPLISLNVYSCFLDGVDNEKIAHQILTSSKPVDEDLSLSEKHKFTHTYYEDVLPPVTPEIKILESQITKSVSQLFSRDYAITELWSIILEPNQSVTAHSHKNNLHIDPNEYFSFCYYPSAPKGSCGLTFYAGWCNTMDTTLTVPAETGKLLVFNSYILHFTQRQNKGLRVNVSGNLAPVQPASTSNADWSPYNARNNGQ